MPSETENGNYKTSTASPPKTLEEITRGMTQAEINDYLAKREAQSLPSPPKQPEQPNPGLAGSRDVQTGRTAREGASARLKTEDTPGTPPPTLEDIRQEVWRQTQEMVEKTGRLDPTAQEKLKKMLERYEENQKGQNNIREEFNPAAQGTAAPSLSQNRAEKQMPENPPETTQTEPPRNPPPSSLNDILLDMNRRHGRPLPKTQPSPESVPGIEFKVYDWSGESRKTLGGTGTLKNMYIEGVPGDPSKAKVKSENPFEGYIMPTYEARRLIQYMNTHHAINSDEFKQLWNDIDRIENGPVTVEPSQKLLDLVSTLGGENKNIIFKAGGYSALRQQSLMASPAMLDRLKDGGMKHIFVTGYPQSMQEYATNVWDAARSGDPKRLEESKKSFVTAMEQKLPPDPLMLRDNAVEDRRKGELYRNTADMIGEAATRGMQVHFTAIPDPRTREQADAEYDRATGSPHQRLRNDRESEFIRLTAQGERFTVITGNGQRRVEENNSLRQQLDNTAYIAMIEKAPDGPYSGVRHLDYYYTFEEKMLGGMKAPRDPLPPGASYRDSPVLGQ